jgi:hypothetical protein
MLPAKQKRDNLATSRGNLYNKLSRPGTYCQQQSAPHGDVKVDLQPPNIQTSMMLNMPTTYNSKYGQASAIIELAGLHVEHEYDNETYEQSRAVLEYLHHVG